MKHTTPQTLLDRLQIAPEHLDAIELHWEDSVATLPAGRLPFLEPNFIRRCRDYCHLDAELDAALLACAAQIESSPDLRLLIWHCHQRLYVHAEGVGFARWPESFEQLTDHGGLFYLLVAQAMVPMVKTAHAGLGVDESITRDTCLEVWGYNENHKVGRNDRPGILAEQLSWIRNYADGHLFRLGRFEYRLKELPTPLRAYRHQTTGAVVVLMPPDTHFNEAGYVVSEDDPAARWTSALTETESGVHGCPVFPLGTARKQHVTLSGAEWEPILAPGDLVLDMHIPPGGGMTPEACRHSFTEAFRFFGQTFPGPEAKAIFCVSWIFNTQFEERLPDSNLASLMRELYLFPVRSGGTDGLSFVFCRDYDDWSQAPRRTRLQRAMIDIHTSGEGLRSSGMLLFKEHLPCFGQQHYRNMPRVRGVTG